MSGKWLGCPYTLPEYAWGLRKHKLWLPLSAEHNELCAKNIEMLLLVHVSQNTRTPHTASECPVLESWWGWQQTWHCPCVMLWPVVPRGDHCQVSRWDNVPDINWIIYLCRWVQVTHNQTPDTWRVNRWFCGGLGSFAADSAACLLFCIQEFYRYNSLLVSIVCAELTLN